MPSVSSSDQSESICQNLFAEKAVALRRRRRKRSVLGNERCSRRLSLHAAGPFARPPDAATAATDEPMFRKVRSNRRRSGNATELRRAGGRAQRKWRQNGGCRTETSEREKEWARRGREALLRSFLRCEVVMGALTPRKTNSAAAERKSAHLKIQ